MCLFVHKFNFTCFYFLFSSIWFTEDKKIKVECTPSSVDTSSLRVTTTIDKSQADNCKLFFKDSKGNFEQCGNGEISSWVGMNPPNEIISFGRGANDMEGYGNEMIIDDLIVWDKMLTEEDMEKLLAVDFEEPE